jgi:hypothetical protein
MPQSQFSTGVRNCAKIAISCSIQHGFRLSETDRFLPVPPQDDRTNAGGFVKYVPPFDLIRRSVEITTVKGELRVNVSYEDFIRILKMMISGVQVNEDWYVRAYEDIGKAIKDGIVKSAQQHFVDDGYFEGRLPFPISVEEKWYLQQNPDVAESVRKGSLASAQVHFDEDGYREGRLPFPM